MDLIDGKTITIISSSIVAIAGAVVGTLFGVGVFKADKANVYEIGAGEIKITSGFVLDEFPVDDTESIEYQNAKDALIKAALAVLEAAAPDLIKNVTEDDVIITIEEQEVFVTFVTPDQARILKATGPEGQEVVTDSEGNWGYYETKTFVTFEVDVQVEENITPEQITSDVKNVVANLSTEGENLSLIHI